MSSNHTVIMSNLSTSEYCPMCGHESCGTESKIPSVSLCSVDAPDKNPQARGHSGNKNAYFDTLLSLGSLGSALFAGQYNKYLDISFNCGEMENGNIQDICTSRFSSDANDLFGYWGGRASYVGVIACAGYTAATTAFYHRHRNNRYQDHFMLLGMTCGIVLGLGTGKSLQGTILSTFPWLTILSLVLSSAAHKIMQWAPKNIWFCCDCGYGHSRCAHCKCSNDKS